jgi:hypothetical protein
VPYAAGCRIYDRNTYAPDFTHQEFKDSRRHDMLTHPYLRHSTFRLPSQLPPPPSLTLTFHPGHLHDLHARDASLSSSSSHHVLCLYPFRRNAMAEPSTSVSSPIARVSSFLNSPKLYLLSLSSAGVTHKIVRHLVRELSFVEGSKAPMYRNAAIVTQDTLPGSEYVRRQ